MTPECRVRVAQALGRDLRPDEIAEVDARIGRSARYLNRNDPDWETLKPREQWIRAGDHAGRAYRAEVEDLLRPFDMDYRLRQAGREVMGEDFERMVEAGRIRFMDRASDMPQYRGGEHDNAVAWTSSDDGHVVLFRDRMEPDAMEEILLHEVGTHAGMEGYLGEKGWADLKQRVDDGLQAGEPEWLDAAALVPRDTPAEHILEEVLAYRIQSAVGPDKFVSAALTKMRAWIFRHVPFVRGRVKLTHAVLRELALGALRREAGLARKLVRRGGILRSVPVESEGSFSKPPAASKALPFEVFAEEMRAIRKDWAPDEIQRAYQLHILYAGLTSPARGAGAAVPDVQPERAGQSPARPDAGDFAAAEKELAARSATGGDLIADSEAIEKAFREGADADGTDLDNLVLFHPDTEQEVTARQLLDEIDADRKAVERLRGCAYP